MENWYPCIICGIARYGHDVIATPRLTSDARVNQWLNLIGKPALNRILATNKNPTLNTFICIEHFEPEELIEPKKRRMKPIKTTRREMAIYENYFRDHGYFETQKSDVNRKKSMKLTSISCSQCSESVERDGKFAKIDMVDHAKLHMELGDCRCEKHKKIERIDRIDGENSDFQCSECAFILNAELEAVKEKAEFCFPMFQFEKSKFSNSTLEPRMKPEYIESRPFWNSEEYDPVFLDSDVKFDLIEDFEPPEPEPEPEQVDTELVKLEPIDGDYEHMEGCFSGFEQEESEQPSTSSAPRKLVQQRDRLLENLYQSNRHPSMEDINSLLDFSGDQRSIEAIFGFFERRRNDDNEMCTGDDACSSLRRYLEMELHPHGPLLEPPEIRCRMIKMFEKHWAKYRYVFRDLHSYMFSDALGLPPKYIRQRFEHFKERKNQQQKKQQEEADRAFRERHKPPKPHKPKPKSQYSKFEDETMEKAYMRTVKMNPSSYESRDLLESISISLRMSLIKVHEWFNNRKFVDSIIDQTWRTFSVNDEKRLHSTFLQNPQPTDEQYCYLAKELRAPVKEVMNWFKLKQMNEEREEEALKFEYKLDALTQESIDLFTTIVDGTTVVSVAKRRLLALELDVPYETLGRWIFYYRNREEKSRKSPKLEDDDDPPPRLAKMPRLEMNEPDNEEDIKLEPLDS
ncbi:Homeobox domain-containing protein [Caenorhabditis elegans]|uniref:Homeobox domain-containing protein n=1 Tax=Caenorhabditis elegans TaxID=6239 RepID=Q7K6J1_CAEEL|nr:Homeobox domain-containing protein [Caenorhabditis elegans]CAC35859.3 Homeobox domain-containing protein [Caenorhabditis elegans]|eukprot:NP_499503.2 C. Elegans Homeobox [Caenorhabditis elegans]